MFFDCVFVIALSEDTNLLESWSYWGLWRLSTVVNVPPLEKGEAGMCMGLQRPSWALHQRANKLPVFCWGDGSVFLIQQRPLYDRYDSSVKQAGLVHNSRFQKKKEVFCFLSKMFVRWYDFLLRKSKLKMNYFFMFFEELKVQHTVPYAGPFY